MRARCSYDYAVIRFVPRVERGEFVNVGVIVRCGERDLLEARIELDERRLAALAPGADVTLVRRHLESIAAVCRGGEAAGPIGRLTPRERFDWLGAPRSTIIQTSAVHSGHCDDPAQVADRLLAAMVRSGP